MTDIDPARVPLSHCGSFLSVMRSGDGLYLRGHVSSGRAERRIARLTPLPAASADVKEHATTDRLTLRAGDAELSLWFEHADTLRVTGRGMGLRVEAVMHKAGSGTAYPVDDRRWVLNARPCCLRLGLDPLVGRIEADAPWREGGHPERMNFDLLPDEHGRLDAAVDYFQSTWSRPQRTDADAGQQATRDRLRAFVDGLPPAVEHLAAARDLAGYVMWSATLPAYGLLTRPTVLMSKVVMDQVWSWDHCFNAIALAAGHPDFAWDQLMTVLDHQDEHGCLPDATNPLFRHYNFSKPPIHGWAVGEMLRRRPDLLDSGDRLREVYDKLGRWSGWWLTHRRGEGDPLPYYLHGNDSGWDNATMFDRGTPLMAPDLAAVLALQLEMQGDLADRLGESADADAHRERSRQVIDALVEQLWRGDRFVARLLRDGSDVDSRSLIPLVPLVLGRRLPEAARRPLIDRLPTFLTEHGLATEHPDSDRYTPDGYWRGPIWAPPTMLIVAGLRDLGEDELAHRIATRYCRTCARSGFAENFDALTGSPLRDPAYTWTASVFLLLAADIGR